MGSFNMTCALSRLPVTSSTPIRAFLLAKPKTPVDTSLFGPEAFFVPLTTGITGTYDSYGRIENCKPSDGFNVGAAHFFPAQAENLRELLERWQRRTITMRHYSREIECDVDVAFVREDVYQAALALNGGAAYSIDRTLLKKELEKITEAITRAEERAIWKYSHKGREALFSQDFETARNEFAESEIQRCFHDMPYLGPLFCQGRVDLLPDALASYRTRLINDLSKGLIGEKTIDFAASIAEFLHYNETLRSLCILWQPSTQMIGDNTNYDLNRRFSQAVSAICNQEISELKETGEYNELEDDGDDLPEDEGGDTPQAGKPNTPQPG